MKNGDIVLIRGKIKKYNSVVTVAEVTEKSSVNLAEATLEFILESDYKELEAKLAEADKWRDKWANRAEVSSEKLNLAVEALDRSCQCRYMNSRCPACVAIEVLKL